MEAFDYCGNMVQYPLSGLNDYYAHSAASLLTACWIGCVDGVQMLRMASGTSLNKVIQVSVYRQFSAPGKVAG